MLNLNEFLSPISKAVKTITDLGASTTPKNPAEVLANAREKAKSGDKSKDKKNEGPHCVGPGGQTTPCPSK